MKKLSLVMVFLLIFSVGCASEYKSDKKEMSISKKKEIEKKEIEGLKKDKDTEDNSFYNAEEKDRKIIKTLIVMSSTTEFDKQKKLLDKFIKEYKCVVLNSDISFDRVYKNKKSRTLRYMFKIDSTKLDEFKNKIEKNFELENISISRDDVTSNYIDSKGRLENLKIQRDRIRELLKNAKDIKDIVVIEKRLSNIEYDIERYSKRINKIDNDVKYSNVEFMLDENIRLENTHNASIFTKIKIAFGEGIQNFVYFFEELFLGGIFNLPFLIMIVGGVVLIYRYRKKRKNKMNSKL